jgi:outer membrane immunogenic protein
MMRKQLRAGLALLVLGVAGARAADLPIGVPVYSSPVLLPFTWGGPYFGLNLGGHAGNDKVTTATDTAGGFGPAGAAAIDQASQGSFNPSGVAFGAQAGYNWQFGNAVVGIEADANGLLGTASRTVATIPVVAPGDFLFNSIKEPSLLITVRPRVGWAFDHTLVYATGGYAFETVQVFDTFGSFGGSVLSSSGVTGKASGWTAGAGVEYAFAKQVSLRVEYLFVDLGSFSSPIPGVAGAGPTTVNVQHHYTDNLIRAGLNFLFNGY